MAEGYEQKRMRRPLTGRQAYFLEVPGTASAAAMSVVSFEATEKLGEPYRVTVVVTHPDALTRDGYLGRYARFSIVPEGVTGRVFGGWITGFAVLNTSKDQDTYEITLEAHFAKLARVHTSRIYQHETAPAIIEKVLRRHGLKAHEFSFKLRRKYPQHAFRFQHQMDDLAWVQLLMEQEGRSTSSSARSTRARRS